MKKSLLLLALFTIHCSLFTAKAQVMCVQCFHQNDSIGVGVGSANIIINGGFEMPSCIGGSFCPLSTYYMCNIPNWTCTGGGSSTYAQVFDTTGAWYGSFLSEIIEGNYAVYMGNFYCQACNPMVDDTSCLVYTGCTVTGIPVGYPFNPDPTYGSGTGLSISQTVSGLTPGNIYVLEFWAGGEFDFGDAPGMFAVDVGFGNFFLRDNETDNGMIGTRYIVEFKATAATHTIKFTNWGHICSSCTELVLDNVRLYTPEFLPPSVTLCTVGIEEATKEAVSIYPNPATNELTVNTGNTAPSVITIYDMLSQKLIQQSFTSEIKLNTQALAKGIYMYEVSNGKEVVKGKVIKE